MTDTTDIAALRSEAANIIGLLTAEGHQSFSLDKAADFFDDVFRLLEAERQRAAGSEEELHKALHREKAAERKLLAAQEEIAALKSAHGNMVARCALLRQRTDLPVDRIPAYNALVKAQEEIALLKAQPLKPVVLPAGYSTRNGHPFHEGERNVMIPNKHGDWLSRFDVEHALRVAGFPFTVEGE